jgi:hypothetical protein
MSVPKSVADLRAKLDEVLAINACGQGRLIFSKIAAAAPGRPLNQAEKDRN